MAQLQPESTTKFYNSSKADLVGIVLTPTSCILRCDWTELVWMPTDFKKVWVIQSVYWKWSSSTWLAVIIFRYFFSFLGDLGQCRGRELGGQAGVLSVLVISLRTCVCRQATVRARVRFSVSVSLCMTKYEEWCIIMLLIFVWIFLHSILLFN